MTIEQKIEQILQKLEVIEERLNKVEAVVFEEKEERRVKKRISPKEFLIAKKPRSGAEKTLVLAYYLEKHRGVSPFTIRDLRQIFMEAKEPIPKNLNDKVNLNIRRGLIMEVGKKNGLKAWTLTNSGEDYVETVMKER